MLVATHDGSFHADDVFAVAALRLAHPALEVVRTRDPDVLARADVRVDIGRRDDPSTGDFDHHQREGAGERPNGIPYASFGLVWRHLGARLCDGDERAAQLVDERLVQGVDAIDSGFTLTRSTVGSVRPFDVSDLLDGFNPDWEDDGSPEQRLARFHEALDVAADVLRRRIGAALSTRRAHRFVEEAVAAAADPRVIVLDRGMPWYEPVVLGAPDALYVIHPKSDGSWGVHAVPRELGAFGNRRDLPEAWAGLDGPGLAAVTGVEDAVFCHRARFLAIARSREGAGELARQALAAGAETVDA